MALNACSGVVSQLERVRIGNSRLRLGQSSEFFGRGRPEMAFCFADHGHRHSPWSTATAYTTTVSRAQKQQQQQQQQQQKNKDLPRIKRRLILLRHAKSSWADRSLKDHNRPLSKKGRLAAADIATKLGKHSWVPELILCSDSLRTRETLEIMQAQYSDLSDAEVRFLGSFYSVAAMDGQTAQHIQENVLRYCRDDITTAMCMGHNRGWEEAASQLCGIAVELKTANAALLEAPGSSWKEAFEKAGWGGWKLVGIMKPDSTSDVEYEIA